MMMMMRRRRRRMRMRMKRMTRMMTKRMGQICCTSGSLSEIYACGVGVVGA
jgi:hypothetical protein